MVDELVDPPEYDPEFYAKRLATALGRITEAFGWNEKELLQGTRQQTLRFLVITESVGLMTTTITPVTMRRAGGLAPMVIAIT